MGPPDITQGFQQFGEVDSKFKGVERECSEGVEGVEGYAHTIKRFMQV